MQEMPKLYEFLLILGAEVGIRREVGLFLALTNACHLLPGLGTHTASFCMVIFEREIRRGEAGVSKVKQGSTQDSQR
jgi:hypothetical protein